jgi:hypothetical protein
MQRLTGILTGGGGGRRPQSTTGDRRENISDETKKNRERYSMQGWVCAYRCVRKVLVSVPRRISEGKQRGRDVKHHWVSVMI